ncbi:hypothetical protein SMMN14_05142 [Sphaerulina musiva]
MEHDLIFDRWLEQKGSFQHRPQPSAPTICNTKSQAAPQQQAPTWATVATVATGLVATALTLHSLYRARGMRGVLP